MVKELKSMDVRGVPDLLRLAEEVRETGEPRLLRRDQEDLAILSPVFPKTRRRARRIVTVKDIAAFRSAAGSWNEVDIDRFLADNAESRQRATQRPLIYELPGRYGLG